MNHPGGLQALPQTLVRHIRRVRTTTGRLCLKVPSRIQSRAEIRIFRLACRAYHGARKVDEANGQHRDTGEPTHVALPSPVVDGVVGAVSPS